MVSQFTKAGTDFEFYKDPEAKTLSPNQVISLKKFRQRPFPRTYPTLIVRDDGSSYRIWSSE